jgi:hypothetical protein
MEHEGVGMTGEISDPHRAVFLMPAAGYICGDWVREARGAEPSLVGLQRLVASQERPEVADAPLSDYSFVACHSGDFAVGWWR